MNNVFVASTLANDPHTEGLHNAGRIANLSGVTPILLEPSDSLEELSEAIKKYNPRFIGLSYRLSPEIGLDQLERTLHYFINTGLINPEDDIKITFAGLPETIKLVEEHKKNLPLKVSLCHTYPDIMDRAEETVNFFGSKNKSKILAQIREELKPKGIEILDQLADEVIKGDIYKLVPPLPVPSVEAVNSYVSRIKESPIPILRSHFGIPGEDIRPTEEGIKQLAEARVVDEISLGSSDLSQRYFGYPEMFKNRKNDGGVPYATVEDLRKLFLASRRGNFPAVKPYCHVNNIVNFVDECISIGLLKGGHQAIPLYWFNELDGRGDKTVRESIKEHFEGVKELVKHGIPVEMNDPNQWSSRLAHDSIIVSSYALISAVMTMCGAKDMVFQMQMNKPKETGDYADLAKMTAGMQMAKTITKYAPYPINIIRETRAGIEHFSPDMNHAKWQLGRTTLLQMLLNPHVIHIVSYCEANYAARPEDIIDSSKLIRYAIKIFKENEHDIRNSINNDIITERTSFLLKESHYILNEVAKFNPNYKVTDLEHIAPLIGNADVIADSIENKIMASPGIINPKYKANYITKAMKYGMINAVTDYNNPTILHEEERIKNYANAKH